MTVLKAKKGARISLVTVFSAGLAGILFIFVLLSYFTFSRLLSFESTLTDVSDRSLPNLIRISQLYSQSATLLESTELLSKSSTNASKRLAEKQLQANLTNIRQAAKEIFENEFLDTQLNTIFIELEEFSTLINIRLETLNRIEFLTAEMYKLNAQAVNIEENGSSPWMLVFSQASVSASRALNEKKLQTVRFLFSQLKTRLFELDTLAAKERHKSVKQPLSKQLNTLLFSDNGMQALKIKSLRLEGRAIGRANFVHNLIEDYVSQLGFVTNETEKNMTNQVANSVADMKKQTHQIRNILIGGVVVLLMIVVLFQKRVLKRIRIFNQMVRNKTQGFENQTVLAGNDEITDLVEAFKEFTHTIEMQNQKLEQLSLSDGLTGIANRRALDIRLKHDIELSIRQKSNVAVLLMDIDCFKLYNDNYGHSAGDQCLKDVSKVICEALHRDSDFVARYGGEEFVCVLPNTDAKGAQELAIHIIEKLKLIALPHKFSKVAEYITMSIGIAASQSNHLLTPEAIIRQADTALYTAKKSGKNTYHHYSSTTPLK
ncbi:diguanylate cyclase [uncultured Paraglaciecola sp.]|uniref:diguanylate cyclase n=1 Tax=uncultured Paraglaciecola sp. TaxID=1765024 RepID=UPI0030DBA470|tara:strand:+ start:46038 stop:47672 length:1635 start_codon:yes stop_codon:yes gene_type:complete